MVKNNMKFNPLLFVVMLLPSMFSYAENISPLDGAPIQNEFEAVNIKDAKKTISKFHFDALPLNGNVVYGEPFFASSLYDSEYIYRTIFPIKKVIKVYSANGEPFEEGQDYTVTELGIKITSASRIKKAPVEFLDEISDSDLKNYGVKVSTEVQEYQYYIAYEKDERYEPKRFGKINYNCKECSVTFFGDSITLGANSSSTYAEPYQPPYVGIVMDYMALKHKNIKWSYRNTAVGGWNTNNAVSAFPWRVNGKKSDIVVLGFGMNDGGGISPSLYKENLSKVIIGIREKNPNVPIVLIGSTRANPKAKIQREEYITQYRIILAALAKQYKNVVFVDVTDAWDFARKNKSYYDLTGNGLNHPNDFGHRLIANVVISALQ